MAQIYNPWEQPPSDSLLSTPLASKEFESPAPAAMEMADGNGSEHMEMMAEALEIIDTQSQLIKQLTAQLAGTAPAPMDADYE